MKKTNTKNIGKVALIIAIIAVIISLSGLHITTEQRTIYKFIEIDFTGWGWVTCPDSSCVKVNDGFDKEGIYCNVPITECPSGEYMVEKYSVCYNIHYNYNNAYLTFNANHNYGFVDGCIIPVYKNYITLKRR